MRPAAADQKLPSDGRARPVALVLNLELAYHLFEPGAVLVHEITLPANLRKHQNILPQASTISFAYVGLGVADHNIAPVLERAQPPALVARASISDGTRV